MRVAGVVVEYNPMHNGHVYHLQQTKKSTGANAIIAVMSGNFLQRGEPAIVDKWSRTHIALQNGVDLVLELPFGFVNQNATQFAYGAIATLDALGIVNALCFGSETGDIRSLDRISRELADPSIKFQHAFEHYNTLGLSFPKAMAEALSTVDPDPSLQQLVKKPNNALGIAYLQALQKLGSAIKPYTIARIHADYHEPVAGHESIASATAIRSQLIQPGQKISLKDIQQYIPATTLYTLQDCIKTGKQLQSWESFAVPLLTKLDTLPAQQLEAYVHIDEGLAYRIHWAARQSTNVNELIRRIKTKRYTWTRIQRALTSILLGLTKESLQIMNTKGGPSYIRILGFTNIGRQLLKQAKSSCRLPIITNIDRNIDRMLEFDLHAARVYSRTYYNRPEELQREFAPPVMHAPATV